MVNQHDKVRLNLGSGGRPLEGWVNVDKNKNAVGVNVVHDLDEYPWPFETESVYEVFVSQCLELFLGALV
jgi:hypothetical protein